MTYFTQGNWYAKPGHADAFVAAWTEFAVWSKEAFPTLEPLLMRDLDAENHFVSIGPWPTLELIDDWRASEQFQECIAKIREHVDDFSVTLLTDVADLR